MPHSSCVESRHAADQTPLSQRTLSDWVIWSVTHTLSNRGPSYPNSAGEQGEEIEFPPSKTGLQIPINRSLESLQSIKFHLPRWSGQSGSSFYTQRVGVHEHTHKHARSHAEKPTRTRALKHLHRRTHAQTDKYAHNQTKANMHTNMRTHSRTPPLRARLSINNQQSEALWSL